MKLHVRGYDGYSIWKKVSCVVVLTFAAVNSASLVALLIAWNFAMLETTVSRLELNFLVVKLEALGLHAFKAEDRTLLDIAILNELESRLCRPKTHTYIIHVYIWYGSMVYVTSNYK